MARAPHHPEVVWYTACPAPTPLSIAWQLGWVQDHFRDHGIEVRSIRDAPDAATRASHFDHRLDWSFRQGGCIPPIWARANGRETRVIGITETPEFQAVVALPESGIRAPADLAGRRFGLTANPRDRIDFHRATALKGLVSALEGSGVGPEAVALTDIPLAQGSLALSDSALYGPLGRPLPYGPELRALVTGTVDAIFVKGAEGVIAANLAGASVVVETGFDPDPGRAANNGTPRPLTVDARFLDEAPELVAGLAETVARAGRWAAGNAEAARRHVALQIGVSEAAVTAAMGPDLHHHLHLALDERALLGLAHMGEFLAARGFTPAPVAIRDWIRADALAAAV